MLANIWIALMFDYVEHERCMITKDYITKQKSFPKPCASVDDERFPWIMGIFLLYFSN